MNKHKHLPEVIFDKCAHGDEIEERKWLEEGLCDLLYINDCILLHGQSNEIDIQVSKHIAMLSDLFNVYALVNLMLVNWLVVL